MTIRNDNRFFTPMKVIVVTGGKGGIGKTNIAVNLALSLTKMHQEVLLFDADFALANVDLILNMQPKLSVYDVLFGGMTLNHVIQESKYGFLVLPSIRGNFDMSNLSTQSMQGLIHNIADLPTKPNVLVIDTAAGINHAVVSLALSATEILIVVCNEPASIADSYALIKLLNQQYGVKKFRVVTNKTHSDSESSELFAKLTRVTDKFLDVSMYHAGSIFDDRCMEKAVQKREPVVAAYPNAKSSVQINDLAKQVISWPMPHKINSGLSFSNYVDLN